MGPPIKKPPGNSQTVGRKWRGGLQTNGQKPRGRLQFGADTIRFRWGGGASFPGRAHRIGKGLPACMSACSVAKLFPSLTTVMAGPPLGHPAHPQFASSHEPFLDFHARLVSCVPLPHRPGGPRRLVMLAHTGDRATFGVHLHPGHSPTDVGRAEERCVVVTVPRQARRHVFSPSLVTPSENHEGPKA